jgi:hypothetical protein
MLTKSKILPTMAGLLQNDNPNESAVRLMFNFIFAVVIISVFLSIRQLLQTSKPRLASLPYGAIAIWAMRRSLTDFQAPALRCSMPIPFA